MTFNLKDKKCWFQYKSELQRKVGIIKGYFNDHELIVSCEDTGKDHIVKLTEYFLI